ncbi:cyclin-dependent kinase [Fusarium mundagurra]|uniref:Cyclin-dependent kinase n=1 Tax=Fusarium mundagurra TaxID=1567541 RepID=A0A8H6DRK2_9HYPO|nr:cyclin-dependent kinase [Fusarium mundagurra]
MSSPWKKQPEDVVDSVLKRAEVSKIARRLQNRLALAKFKTKHGWEDLTLDSIEPKIEEEMRRKRLTEPTDVLSDSSSSASDLPYPSRALMSSPLKAPLFSDAVGSSNGSTGHRKRTYLASFHDVSSSPSKRFRLSPTAHKSFGSNGVWKNSHQLTRSSPLKPRRQQHFTTSGGPDVSFFQQRLMSRELTSPNFAAPSDDDDDLLPIHSFHPTNIRSSPPRTPPMRTRSVSKRNKGENGAGTNGKTGEEGADLLLYLAASPSPAVRTSTRTRMEPPSTPPQKNKQMDLPSSMMMTPGGGNLFPTTPSQAFDFAEFVNITPSPAQKPFKTPISITATRTPVSGTQRRLTFD